MKFKVTSGPTYLNGRASQEFKIGDVVEVENVSPDHDGDVMARKEGGSGYYIALSDLTPQDSGVVQISAVRAALVALGIEADVVAVAQAIEAAIA